MRPWLAPTAHMLLSKRALAMSRKRDQPVNYLLVRRIKID